MKCKDCNDIGIIEGKVCTIRAMGGIFLKDGFGVVVMPCIICNPKLETLANAKLVRK